MKFGSIIFLAVFLVNQFFFCKQKQGHCKENSKPGCNPTTSEKNKKVDHFSGISPNGTLLYITIDDGPSDHTLEIAKYLNGFGIPATFYVLGKFIEGREETLRYLIQSGHSVGNHTFSHQIDLLKKSIKKNEDEIEETALKIKSACGDEGLLLRIPYGCFGCKKYLPDRILKKYYLLNWDIDSKDSLSASEDPKAIVKNIKTGLKKQKKKKLVLLFHDRFDRWATLPALKLLIPGLIREGYRFAKVDIQENLDWVNKEKMIGFRKR